jgi:hypothetical protein
MGEGARTVAWAVLALSVSSCRACKNEHPFVPYSIDGEALPSRPPDAAEDAPATPEAAAYGDAAVVVAPPDAQRWTLAGLDLVAPPGRVFALGLSGDFDGDGKPDAFTVVRRASGPDLGEAWFYRGDGGGVAPGVLAGAPDPVTLDPSCSPERRIARTGPRSALFEVRATCAERGARHAERWLGVFDLHGTPARRTFAEIADPDAAPALSLDVERWDFDHDGLDDLLLRATLEGGGPPFEPGPRVSAVVRFLDKRAGLSREADEPEGSFHALAVGAMTRAGKPKEAAAVPLFVHQARALFVALCAEGRAPRVLDFVNGHGILCGQVRALDDLSLAEARAYATLGDPLRAATALDRVPGAAGSKQPARVAEAAGWIEKIAQPALATTLRAVMALPRSERSRSPAWGALAFEPSGKLLVRTPAGVVRVDPLSGDESDAAGVAAWGSDVVSPDGARRLIDVYDPCDAFALRATIVSTRGNEARDVPLPVDPALASRCQGTRGQPVRALPIAWGPLGLELLAAGSPVLVSPDLLRAAPLAAPLGQPVNQGSPRSPDGLSLAVPVTLGILVLGAHPRLLRARELDGAYGELYDCTVSDDTSRVACVRGGRAFVGVWPAPK